MKADGDVSAPFVLTPEQTASLNTGGGDAGGPSSGDGDSGNPSQEAGQDTALGGDHAIEAETVADTSGSGNDQAIQAIQTAGGIRDGVANWDNIRTIEAGQAHFNGSGNWDATTCGGGSCANNSAGSFSFNVDVDFGARTFGSSGSNWSGSDSDTNISGGSSSGGSISPSVAISATSFAALTKDASVTVVSGTCTADFSFINSNGSAATSMTAKLSYDDGPNTSVGSGSASKQDGYLPQ